jgi:hypothetical protein
MQVIQAVYGVFHHFELAHQLHTRHHLRRIYSTWPWARLKREGLPRELVRTFPPVHTADTLLRRTRFYTPALDARLNQWNSLSFDAWTRRVVEPCDAFIAISGAGLTTGPKVQAAGGKFICDRGSTHQRFQDQSGTLRLPRTSSSARRQYMLKRTRSPCPPVLRAALFLLKASPPTRST